ncbi:MAG: hypothetical protein ABI818_19060 [Acidobacteriota bacterium]
MTPTDPVEARLLDEWPLPEPSARLRTRVLGAARPHVTPQVSWTDRLWFSRGWRLAAAAILLGLAVVERIPEASISGRHDVVSVAAALESARAVTDTALDVGLRVDQADRLARQTLLAAMRPPPAALREDLAAADTMIP